MKKLAFILSLVLLQGFLFESCRRREKIEKLDTNLEEFNADANRYRSEMDDVDNDINSSLENTSLGGRMDETYSSPLCGVTIDTSQIANKILFYNFDGVTPCFSPSRTRAGQVKVELINGNRWRDAGSVLQLTYINFVVTRLSDNKSITINGTKTLKNMDGINWLTFLLGTSQFRFQERALNIQVNFSSGATATWNSARITTWNYIKANQAPGIPYGHVKFTANGDTALSSVSAVDSWGVNRFGDAFVTNYISPWVSNSYCGFWRPVSGKLNHQVGANLLTIEGGLDQNGNPSPAACAYGYRVTWTGANGNSNSEIKSY
jgi:outer membrane murein-binding lipoprotein Lpp